MPWGRIRESFPLFLQAINPFFCLQILQILFFLGQDIIDDDLPALIERVMVGGVLHTGCVRSSFAFDDVEKPVHHCLIDPMEVVIILHDDILVVFVVSCGEWSLRSAVGALLAAPCEQFDLAAPS